MYVIYKEPLPTGWILPLDLSVLHTNHFHFAMCNIQCMCNAWFCVFMLRTASYTRL